MDLFPPRTRPQPRLPLGRGRHLRALRPGTTPVLRSDLLERRRPHPQRTLLRSHRSARQPRRGREGGILVSRSRAHRLVVARPLPLSATPLPLRPLGRRKRPARSARSGIRTPRYRRLRGGSLLRDRGRLRQSFAGRHPHPHHREKLRTRPGPALDSADAVVPQSLDMGSRATESVESRHLIHRTPHGSGRIARRMVAGRPRSRGNPFHRKRNQQHAPLRHAGRLAVHQGCLSSPPRRRREGGGQSGESRNQSRRRLPFQPRPGHLGHFGNATPLGACHEPGGFPPGNDHPGPRVHRIL